MAPRARGANLEERVPSRLARQNDPAAAGYTLPGEEEADRISEDERVFREYEDRRRQREHGTAADLRRKWSKQEEDALRYIHKSRALAEETLKDDKQGTRKKSSKAPAPAPRRTARNNEEPNRPSFLRRLFSSQPSSSPREKYSWASDDEIDSRPSPVRQADKKKTKYRRPASQRERTSGYIDDDLPLRPPPPPGYPERKASEDAPKLSRSQTTRNQSPPERVPRAYRTRSPSPLRGVPPIRPSLHGASDRRKQYYVYNPDAGGVKPMSDGVSPRKKTYYTYDPDTGDIKSVPDGASDPQKTYYTYTTDTSGIRPASNHPSARRYHHQYPDFIVNDYDASDTGSEGSRAATTNSTDGLSSRRIDPSDYRRDGPRSSKRDAVPLGPRIPLVVEDPPSDEERALVVFNSTDSTLKPLVDIPEQEEVEFRAAARKPAPARDVEVDPTIFGWSGEHIILGPNDEDLFVAANPLGHGSLGVVEEVRRVGGPFPTLVRKRVDLPLPKRRATTYLEIVQEEARILRSLIHPHIVTLIGSYEDQRQPRRPSYCLLMSPVGENDLEAFLTIVGDHALASEFSLRWRPIIRNWMACLASALAYMHASGIRHQDIKPSNIIHKGTHVFFTDFSSSSTFKIGHTTSTGNPARSTPMYGAPEVTSGTAKHGRATDIFSLGCVFANMLSVVEGRSVMEFQDFLRSDGVAGNGGGAPPIPPRALSYSEKVGVIGRWFEGSDAFGACVADMLRVERKERPSARRVVERLVVERGWVDADCACARKDEIADGEDVAERLGR